MNCRDMEDLLSAFINNELSAGERSAVEAHLEECVVCRKKLESYRAVRSSLETLRTVPAAPDIREAVMSGIRSAGVPAKPARGWRRRVLAAVPIMAVLAALLIIRPWGLIVGPENILAKAHSAIENIRSYRISVTGSGTEGSTIFLETEFTAPDRYHLKQTVNGQYLEVILIGDDQYYKGDFNSFITVKAMIRSYASLVSRETTLTWLDMLTGICTLPEETVDGTGCLHYRGVYDMEKMLRSRQEEDAGRGTPPMSEEELEEMLEEYRQKAGTRTIELWIGKDDYLLRRLNTESRRTDENGETVSSSHLYQFSAFNQPLEIEAPLEPGGGLAGWASTVPEQQAFSKSMEVEVDNSDPQNREIKYTLTVVNISGERIGGIETRVMADYSITNSGVGVRKTGGQEGPGDDGVDPESALVYRITFSYDASLTGPQEVADYINRSTAYISYPGADGQEKVETAGFEAPASIFILPADLPSMRDLAPAGEYRIEETGASSAGVGVAGEIDGASYLFVRVNTQNSEIEAEPGLLVLDISEPARPVKTAYLKAPENTVYLGPMALSGSVLYIYAGDFIWIVDVSSPGAPAELARFSGVKPGLMLAYDKYLFVNDYNQKLFTLDISNPAGPEVIGSLELPSRSGGTMHMAGGYLLAWTGDSLLTIDISSPASPEIVNSYAFGLPPDTGNPSLRIYPGHVVSKDIRGNLAFVSLGGDAGQGISILDISDPAAPREIAFYALKDRTFPDTLFVSGDRLYLYSSGMSALGRKIDRIEFMDISDPAGPALTGFGILPDWWTFFEKHDRSSSSRSYYLVEDCFYWFIGNSPNQPVLEIFDLADR
ncbi:MAG: zf-HC2 domain-containing protein [Dehalococcoidales bacterium]|nr:zf-HC2 domain-containing protein [Dehalococcoidales bacterium]